MYTSALWVVFFFLSFFSFLFSSTGISKIWAVLLLTDHKRGPQQKYQRSEPSCYCLIKSVDHNRNIKDMSCPVIDRSKAWTTTGISKIWAVLLLTDQKRGPQQEYQRYEPSCYCLIKSVDHNRNIKDMSCPVIDRSKAWTTTGISMIWAVLLLTDQNRGPQQEYQRYEPSCYCLIKSVDHNRNIKDMSCPVTDWSKPWTTTGISKIWAVLLLSDQKRGPQQEYQRYELSCYWQIKTVDHNRNIKDMSCPVIDRSKAWTTTGISKIWAVLLLTDQKCIQSVSKMSFESMRCTCVKMRERNVLFNDALNTFYLRLYGVRHMVKEDHSDSEKGNPLPPHRPLLSINSKGSFICTIPQTG